MKQIFIGTFIIIVALHFFSGDNMFAQQDLSIALRRAQYLLNGTFPQDHDFTLENIEAYKSRVRSFLDHDNFYNVILEYHRQKFGIGLPTEYIDELMREEIDHKSNKFAQILCGETSDDGRLRCSWASEKEKSKISSCPKAWEVPVSIFWYKDITAWVCPTVEESCGSNLSNCFIEYEDSEIAENSQLGETQAFDSRSSVIKSLGLQSAGLATAVVVNNYPYTKILEPGLTSVDGAVAHFYKQEHHFDLNRLKLPDDMLKIVSQIPLTDTRFHLIYTGNTYEQAGILSTFGWLRRYEKNRTRANQLYERLLCRQFTAELPKIFPQDPGNLRETPGCSGCHATLDPLADFFSSWGEGGDLYTGLKSLISTTFGGHTGSSLAELANIIRNDNAFATCTVEGVWDWLMGRKFYAAEADLRASLTNYFVLTDYSFKELVFAIASHPVFLEATRSNGLVDDPLSEPPLGEPPGGNNLAECTEDIDFATVIQPQIGLCASSGCHVANNSRGLSPLTTEEEWDQAATEAISLMTSGQMPIGSSGPPRVGPVFELKEAVRCWQERKP